MYREHYAYQPTRVEYQEYLLAMPFDKRNGRKAKLLEWYHYAEQILK